MSPVAYECDKCPKNFMTKTKLNDHIRNVHQEKVMCPCCEKFFSTKHAIEQHLNKRELNDCDLYEKKFTNKTSYKRHMASHCSRPQIYKVTLHLFRKSFNYWTCMVDYRFPTVVVRFTTDTQKRLWVDYRLISTNIRNQPKLTCAAMPCLAELGWSLSSV